MKKIIKLMVIAVAALSMAGCERAFEESTPSSGKVFHASLFQEGDLTKTYIQDSKDLLWTADDRISIFTTTYNQQYRFEGATGDNSGDFTEVKVSGFHTGSKLTTNYAVYPYAEGNKISNDGVLSIEFPSVQQYAYRSFGRGANVMTAVTDGLDDTFLYFHNLCGYIVVKLYGEGVVKSIILESNGGESISGAAKVTMEYGELPQVSMEDGANPTILLDCGLGVVLGTTEDRATEFWFCVPPTVFEEGFTITALNTEGKYMRKSVASRKEVERNVVRPVAAVKAVFDQKDFIVPFGDELFKEYCVQNYDTDGDGEISIFEAKVVTQMTMYTNGMKNLEGIGYFTNLWYLNCRLNWRNGSSDKDNMIHYFDDEGNEVFGLESLDVGNNTALKELYCFNNQLTSLDVSKNTALKKLYCTQNQLTSLDVSNNTALTSLSCFRNQLTSLDVSNNTALTSLSCSNNQLTSLDVSHNTSLTSLSCDYNQLTSLDVSKNTALTSLSCGNNQLTSLDVSKNTALTSLSCGDNQLTSLDVSKNTALKELFCFNNQLTSLDVSNNTAFTQLGCSDNHLTSLDVSKNTALTFLNCGTNQLTSLDVSKNTALTYFCCDNNRLTSLDVSNTIALTSLYCFGNQLSSLDVSKNSVLTYLTCSPMPSLASLYVAQGQIISGVTVNRDSNNIPDGTDIVVVDE